MEEVLPSLNYMMVTSPITSPSSTNKSCPPKDSSTSWKDDEKTLQLTLLLVEVTSPTMLRYANVELSVLVHSHVPEEVRHVMIVAATATVRASPMSVPMPSTRFILPMCEFPTVDVTLLNHLLRHMDQDLWTMLHRKLHLLGLELKAKGQKTYEATFQLLD